MSLRRILFIVLIAGAGLRVEAASDEKGWTSIFNGKDLAGWRTFVDPGSTVPADQIWSVKEGVLICKGRPGGYVITEKEYSDYVLRFEWRWDPADKGGRNSGALVHVSGPDKLWPKGVEAQLAAGAAGDFWILEGFKLAVDPTRRDPAQARHYFRMMHNVEKPIGEWNQYEIHCKGDTVTLMVNGELVNEGKEAEHQKGKILLQSEGAAIHFRNIMIRPVGGVHRQDGHAT